MLLFAFFDAAVAFLFVFLMIRAKFGGLKSTFARTLGSLLGTIVFIIYFSTIVWINTDSCHLSHDVIMVIYLAPIVLTILMTILVLLSLPPKQKEEEENELNEENKEEEEIHK